MDLQIYSQIILAVVVIILFIWVIWLQNKLGKLLVGKSKNLDDSIAILTKELTELKKFKTVTENTFQNHEARLKKAVTGVETVRFNPFKGNGSGGNQSFATALLNEEKNGVIISSLYARDHLSVFAKPIKNRHSEYELTAEEKQALNQAEVAIQK